MLGLGVSVLVTHSGFVPAELPPSPEVTPGARHARTVRARYSRLPYLFAFVCTRSLSWTLHTVSKHCHLEFSTQRVLYFQHNARTLAGGGSLSRRTAARA